MHTSKTFALIKPDAVHNAFSGSIIDRLLGVGFEVVRSKMVTLTEAHVERLYAKHIGQPYFEKHSMFMQSGPSIAMVLQVPNADVPDWVFSHLVRERVTTEQGVVMLDSDGCDVSLYLAAMYWRCLIGATDPRKAEGHTIRGIFGAKEQEPGHCYSNAVHGADPWSVDVEIAVFWPDTMMRAYPAIDMPLEEDLAVTGFNAYGDAGPIPWKTFDGRDMPRWDAAGEQTKARWQAASLACIDRYLALAGLPERLT